MLTLEYKTQDGGELCPCPIFAKSQLDWSYWLFLIQQYANNVENNEHKNFYVENLVPNQGKNHDLPAVGFSHFTNTGK